MSVRIVLVGSIGAFFLINAWRPIVVPRAPVGNHCINPFLTLNIITNMSWSYFNLFSQKGVVWFFLALLLMIKWAEPKTKILNKENGPATVGAKTTQLNQFSIQHLVTLLTWILRTCSDFLFLSGSLHRRYHLKIASGNSDFLFGHFSMKWLLSSKEQTGSENKFGSVSLMHFKGLSALSTFQRKIVHYTKGRHYSRSWPSGDQAVR